MESSTKILRRMLDERGVEYEGGERSLRWRDRNGVMMQAFPLADGKLGMDVWSCTPEQAIAATLGDDLQAENAKLREQMERLVTLLRVDCDIDASWDGLRRFWSIGLTEDGCLMRDRACKAEAENAKLRELVRYMHRCYVRGHDWGPYGAPEKEWVEEQMRDLGIEAG